MQADVEHAGRKQAGIVDAHGVHPALAKLHVAWLAVIGLLGRAQRIARHPAAHVLVAHLRRHDVLAAELGAPRHGDLAQNVVLHERENVGEILVLVVVGVDVDDQDVVELAAVGFLARVGEQAGSVQFVD